MNNDLVAKNIWFKENLGFEDRKKDASYILKDINISIKRGASLTLLGPSGCGKTTLLRIIAGLEKPDLGEIFFRGKNMTNIPPHKRNFGMMFQDFALFPQRNVFENISFGLEMKKFSKKRIESRVKEMLELVNLENYVKRDIRELSGGERQRVALARTLAPSPELIMLDEPLGALDRRLRERLLTDLSLILDKTGITTIWVTHDHNEAFAVSDIVCVINNGKVQQIDSPEYIYQNPANRIVADFLGLQNIIEVQDGVSGYGYVIILMPDSASAISEKESFSEQSIFISGVMADSVFQGAVRKVSINQVKITANTLFNNEFNKALSGVLLPAEQHLYFDLPAYTHIPKIGESFFLKINPEGIRVIK